MKGNIKNRSGTPKIVTVDITGKEPLKNDALGIALISSLAIHICAIMIAATFLHTSPLLHRQDFLPIRLMELPSPENPPARKIETIPEVRKLPSPPLKVEKPKAPTPQPAKAPTLKAEAPPPSPAVKEEPAKAIETKPPVTSKLPPASFAPDSHMEGGGSEADAGNLYGRGDIGVIPGPGAAGGGGGTAASGLGRGSGAPGLPAQAAPFRTNREAKPIQTARAAYPPMALRAGIESDVTLKIEVDTEGKVIKAEIIKTGGAGFDEEALKAVKESRFEPAQRDGQSVSAEFTYIYRFRLQR